MKFTLTLRSARVPRVRPPRSARDAWRAADDQRPREGCQNNKEPQLAEMLGVTKFTIWDWKDGRTSPPTHQCSGVTRFLGYEPFPEPVTFAGSAALAPAEEGRERQGLGRARGG